MKAVNTQSSYPGFSDGLIIYQGQTPVNENAKKVRQYKVNTEIRTSLFVSLDAIHSTSNARFQIGFVISTETNGTKTITFQVPRLASVYYFISGSTFKSEETNFELVDEGEKNDWTHGYYLHNHDGYSGVQLVLGNNIQPDNVPFNANKKVVVNATGDRFIYTDINQGANPPVFTTPALNTPADAIEINPNSGDTTTFDWDAATNMINTDTYTILFNAIVNPSNSFHIDVAGDVLSSVQDDIIFDNMYGEVFAWSILATNGDGTGETEPRVIFIST